MCTSHMEETVDIPPPRSITFTEFKSELFNKTADMCTSHMEETVDIPPPRSITFT